MKSARLEVDTELFPFKSRTVELRSGATIHFIDEGQGPLLLLPHGNQTRLRTRYSMSLTKTDRTWSFDVELRPFGEKW